MFTTANMRKLFTLFLLLTCLTTFAQERIFHVSRSLNRNIVCYDVQLKGGKIDTSEPLNVYWYNNEARPGETYPITFIQRQLAYGYSVEKKGKDEVTVKLKAYKKRPLRICKHGGKWVGITTINGKECILKEIYAHCPSKTSCDYVELRGKALNGGTDEKETVK